MDSEHVVSQLFATGVLTEVGDEDITVTNEFHQTFDEWRNSLAGLGTEALRSEIESVLSVETPSDVLLEIFQQDTDRLAEYVALADHTDELCHEDRLRILPAFDQLLYDAPPTDGAPEPFFPIHGHRLGSVIRSVEAAVIYIWRDDCPPCDTVKADLEEVFAEPADDIALYSVFGPDAARILQEEFQVTGGPVVLFVRDGRIDSRLVGAQYPEAVEAETEKLRSR